jgi:hypothetical protein
VSHPRGAHLIKGDGTWGPNRGRGGKEKGAPHH